MSKDELLNELDREIRLWESDLYHMAQMRRRRQKTYNPRKCEWNEDIEVRRKSKVYQERVRKAFSADNQLDDEEMALRDAFFTDKVFIDETQSYKTIPVPDFDGMVKR